MSTSAVQTPVVKTPAMATPVVKTPAVATPVVKTSAMATPVVKTPAVATPVVKTPGVATPAIPPRHESYGMPMTALRKCHPHLYADKSDQGRRQLVWEKLWTTTSGDYGRFSNSTKRQHTNKNRGDIFRSHGWDTTGEEIGEDCARASPATSHFYSRHMTPDVLNVDAEKRGSSQKSEKAATPLPKYPKIPPVSLKSHPRPHVLPAVIERSRDRFDINSINKSRPHLTSGYAKQYVRSTEGPFWDNLETLRA